MDKRRFILKNYKKEVKKSEGCGIIYMQGEKKSPHKFKVILNNSLQKSNSNLVKVAVTVNGKTGQYSSHRWKNPTVAFDILKESLKEAGIKNPDTVTFINKKTGKEVNKDTLMAHYKRRGNPLTLQEFVKENYEIKEDSKLGNGDGGDDGGHVKRLHEMILNTETNTTEHAGEDSLKKHTDENGKLTEEREKLHREIILEHFKGLNPVEGQRPVETNL